MHVIAEKRCLVGDFYNTHEVWLFAKNATVVAKPTDTSSHAMTSVPMQWHQFQCNDISYINMYDIQLWYRDVKLSCPLCTSLSHTIKPQSSLRDLRDSIISGLTSAAKSPHVYPVFLFDGFSSTLIKTLTLFVKCIIYVWLRLSPAAHSEKMNMIYTILV